ncbi:type I-E CRISPR-associated endoribonuclease Cas2 [Synechococcales cyanobacterium C]|uniref:Type I-E CRISPR-associated endoribonuclease Cas2 n=1 Tax=Petrachloros mirabilis ULC683 TaxID=2781853 RepID=A0A8K2A6I7_9CYAN|nr:type I-E CRISPR-associated endoribonuclease Cas2e [Petrachloros mirabilis]NCJ05364.1 type I-E CRISPR-associated endoribonuclease Cas2 [Petrachloros mirabilis ULC683]
MVVFILENVSPSLRGEVSRWLFEVKAGVFTGKLSALVRDELWAYVAKKLGNGSAVLIYSTNNEQGFSARMLGNSSRTLVDIEGVLLVKT